MFDNIILKQLNADAQETAGSANADEAATATTTAPVETVSAHDDFDWSVDRRNVILHCGRA
jgi:small subunit ribosomal protein S1